MALHADLLEQAFALAKPERGKPKQASLRRALWCAYYALFRGDFEAAATGISQSTRMRVRTRKGSHLVVARGLISRRAEESAPFRTRVE